MASGNTAGSGDEVAGACGGTAEEFIYEYSAPQDGTYLFSLAGSSFDTVLYIKAEPLGCSWNELACNDDSVGVQSQVSLAMTTGQTVFVMVDGFGGATGAYTLNVSIP